MHAQYQALTCTAILSLLVTACSPIESPAFDEDVPSARPAQLDPDVYKEFINYHFEIDSNPLFDLLVIGDEDVGSFESNTEYWYVYSSALADLGTEDIEVSSTSGDVDPPAHSGDQEFTQPVYLTWQSFLTDPVSAGELYNNGDYYLRLKVESGEVTRIVWYQTIDSQSPTNVSPKGTFTAVGGSVSVPNGQYGYYIDATIE